MINPILKGTPPLEIYNFLLRYCRSEKNAMKAREIAAKMHIAQIDVFAAMEYYVGENQVQITKDYRFYI